MGEHGITIKADWGRLKTRDFAKFQKTLGLVETQVALFIKVVTECPWGDPALEETYLSDSISIFEYDDFVDVVMALKGDPEDMSGYLSAGTLKVDWNLASVKVIAEFQKNAGSVGAQAVLLARVVTEIPWGDAAKEETYLDLPLPVYEGLLEAVLEERKRSANKFRRGGLHTSKV